MFDHLIVYHLIAEIFFLCPVFLAFQFYQLPLKQNTFPLQTLKENAYLKERISSMESKLILLTSDLDRSQSKSEKLKSQTEEVKLKLTSLHTVDK